MGDYPFYHRYQSDFLNGCHGLNWELRGVYSTVIDMIYDRNGPIPFDPGFIAAGSGMGTAKTRNLLQQLIDADKLFVIDGPRYPLISNMRAEAEIAKRENFRKTRQISGSIGGKRRANRDAEARKNNYLGQASLNLRARDLQLERKEGANDAVPSAERRSLARQNGERTPSDGEEKLTSKAKDDIPISEALSAKYSRTKRS